MKYLKPYKLFTESILSMSDMMSSINDILSGLKDDGFSIDLYHDNEYEIEGEEDDNPGTEYIHYRLIIHKDGKYKWSEVKSYINHLISFVDANYYNAYFIFTYEVNGKGRIFNSNDKDEIAWLNDEDFIFTRINISLVDRGFTQEDLDEDEIDESLQNQDDKNKSNLEEIENAIEYDITQVCDSLMDVFDEYGIPEIEEDMQVDSVNWKYIRYGSKKHAIVIRNISWDDFPSLIGKIKSLKYAIRLRMNEMDCISIVYSVIKYSTTTYEIRIDLPDTNKNIVDYKKNHR